MQFQIIYGANEGEDVVSVIMSGALFFILVVGSVFATQKYEFFCSSIRTALATGLALAMTADMLLHGALIAAISAVLRMKISRDDTACFTSCHVPQLLGLWIVWTVIAWIIQNNLSGQMKRWMSNRGQSYNYQAVNTKKFLSDTKIAAQQRTFSYPDALEFNFYDPDNLPEMLQPYAEVLLEYTRYSIIKYQQC